MSYLVVFIDDKIRDEQVAHNVNLDSTVSAEVERYVDQYGLPRRFLGGSRIEYELVRAADGTHLSDRTTFRQANIIQGEMLQLVSSKGRRVWRVVQRLLDEIESETIDQATGKIKDKIAEKAANQIRDKLAEIEKTQTGGQRVEQVRILFRQVIQPPGPNLVHRILGIAADKIWSAFISVSVAVAISTVGAVLVYGLSSPSRDEQPIPTPTERVMATATATEQPTPTPTKRVMATATATEPPAPQPAVQDTDADGLNDNYEVQIGTDPHNPDTDYDGLSDGGEVGSCTSPLNQDTDGDGRGDGDEVNQGTDPCDPNDPPRDDDRDGLTNEQEYQLRTNPNDPDSDDDGLSDGQEAGSCTNPLDPDTDGDGRGDGDEVNRGTDPCDPNDPPRDDDRDGLTNEQEYQLGTNPNDPDSDDDGLLDGHEAGSCTNPLDPDTDGDELGDGDEVNRGSDPCDPNDPPSELSADADGPYSVGEAQPLTFDGSGSWGNITNYAWDFGDGTTGSGVSPSHSYPDGPAQFLARLTVTDDQGRTAGDTADVTVNNLPPTAEAGGPYTCQVGETIQLAGTCNDPSPTDAAALTCTWADFSGAAFSQPSFTCPGTPGQVMVTLTATDKDGASAQDSAAISVVEVPLIADAGGPYAGAVRNPIAFDGSGSTPADAIQSYIWDFGDGQTGKGVVISHTYIFSGTYTVSLTVANATMQDTDMTTAAISAVAN